MFKLKRFSFAVVAAMAVSFVLPQPVAADGIDLVLQARGGNKPDKPGGGGGDGGSATTGTLQPWMQSDVQLAWDNDFFGQGATITVVDQFGGRNKYFGNLGNGLERKRHGEWTLTQANMIAPVATMVARDFSSDAGVVLGNGFNVVNLSYGWLDFPGIDITTSALWVDREKSLVNHANGGAVVVKSAGNDSIDMGGIIQTGAYAGQTDYLANALKGQSSVLFVGALEGNATLDDSGNAINQVSLANYSNKAGGDAGFSGRFLVVGVDSGSTGLAGTSFAAPIVSGYAAVLSSKFTSASATEVANRLLSTAREDTISGYNVNIHGQGEASISSALAPDKIN